MVSFLNMFHIPLKLAMIFVDFQNYFIFILLCVFSYSFFLKKRNKDLHLPPSPPSLPIIGHLHLLLSPLPYKAFQKISSMYGPLVHLKIFSLPVVLVSSASVAYEVFRMQDVNISSRGITANNESLVLGSSSFIAAPYGDYWKYMKKLIATKLLRPQAMEQSRGVRAEELKRFYFKILDKAAKTESIVIFKEATKFTNNSICMMSMGRSCSEENGEAERVLELGIKSVALTTKIVVAYVLRKPLEKLGISLFKKEIMGVSREFDEFFERILVEHEEKLDENQDKDMMSLLLEAYRDEKAEYKITRNQIKTLFAEIFIAGTDTSAHTTQWTMAEILKNPSVLERLKEEIDSVVGKTRLIQETDLPNLPFLQAVVKEGLRLHPPLPLMFRSVEKACEIKEFYIPEKTILVVNLYAVMRDPNSWEDPNEFKPERFLASWRSGGEDEIREQALKYIPFGSGRRGCPGSNLAYIYIGTAIGMMVQCFDWKIKGEMVNMEEALEGVTLTMAHPFKCIPVVRIDPSTFD